MPDDDRFSSSLQESILTALAYGGQEVAVIQALVSADHFEPPYRDIAQRILDYRFRFSSPPAPGHLDDLFDDILSDHNHKRYQTTQRILVGISELSRVLNVTYIINRVREFIRRQTLKSGVIRAAERYQQGGDDVADDVEKILLETVKHQTEAIDLGTRFNDFNRVFRFLEKPEDDYCLTGIPELDQYGVCPRKRELFLFMAPKGRGKSWWCHYVAKKALQQGWRVLHISLENYEDVVNPRYLQTLFSVGKHDRSYIRSDLYANSAGYVEGLEVSERRPKLIINDGLRRLIAPKMQNWPYTANLVTKEFPSGSLTLNKYEAYLDYLEAAENFVPDLVCLDYPALMAIDQRDFRLSFGRTVVALRGIAARRNHALIAPSQGNREGIKSTNTRGFHASEDISQIFTADTVLTYSQTDEEHRLGLARLYVNNSRNDLDRFTVLVGQAYQIGQFKLSSAMFSDDRYFDMVSSEIANLAGKVTENGR